MPNPVVRRALPDQKLAECFPPTPWQLVPGYTLKRKIGGGVMMLVGLMAAAFYVHFTGGGVRQFLEERAVWNSSRSVEAPALVEGKVKTNRLIFHEYQFKVTYAVDAEGTTRTEPLQFDTLFAKIDEGVEPRVRFDPAEPRRFALNLAMLASTARWGALGFMLIAGVLLVGGSIGFLGWAMYAGASRAEHVAARGWPVVGTITKIEEQRSHGVKTGMILYTFRLPEGLGGKTRSVGIRRKAGTPLWIEDGVRLVVCVDPDDPKAFVALRHDLFPMVFPPGTDQVVRQRVAGLGNAAAPPG
jgi:hypothetical protein